jgi:hypothetical protein
MLKPILETWTGKPLFGNNDHQTFAALRDSKLYGWLYDGEKLITLEGYSSIIAINSNYPIGWKDNSLQYDIKRILDHAAENPSEWTENTMKNTVEALIHFQKQNTWYTSLYIDYIASHPLVEQIALMQNWLDGETMTTVIQDNTNWDALWLIDEPLVNESSIGWAIQDEVLVAFAQENVWDFAKLFEQSTREHNPDGKFIKLPIEVSAGDDKNLPTDAQTFL